MCTSKKLLQIVSGHSHRPKAMMTRRSTSTAADQEQNRNHKFERRILCDAYGRACPGICAERGLLCGRLVRVSSTTGRRPERLCPGAANRGQILQSLADRCGRHLWLRHEECRDQISAQQRVCFLGSGRYRGDANLEQYVFQTWFRNPYYGRRDRKWNNKP